MKSFNGDKKLKLLIQKEIEWHAEQDKLAQGAYSEDGKFCAIGCAIESTNKKLGTTYAHNNRRALEKQFGIPLILWKLEDRIFEGLSKENAMKWPLQFWKALPVGVDLSGVWDRFAVWLLGDKKDGVIQYTKTDEQKKAIQDVINLYKRKIKGEDITQKEWSAAADAALLVDAALLADAVDAAAVVYVVDVVDVVDVDVVDVVVDAAAYAADARQKHYKKMANKLLELLCQK